MTDMRELQDSMLRAARDRGMGTERAEKIFAGLAERIEAGEAAPDPGPLPTDHDRAVAWGPWLLGAVIGAAAVAALMLGTSFRGKADVQDNAVAAPYEATPSDETSRADTRAGRSAATRSKSRQLPRPVAAEPLPAAVVPEPAPVAEDPPASAETKRHDGPKRPRPQTAPADSATPTADVAGEAQALGQAQAALDRNELNAAKQALAAYRKAHPKGALAPEADGLAVLIECKRGTPNAAREAAKFVRAHPRSALRKRIDSACGEK